MICWGERNCCGVFIDRSQDDRCDCLRDRCIRDYSPDQRIASTEDECEDVVDDLRHNIENHLIELDQLLNIKSIASDLSYANELKQLVDRLSQRLLELDFEVEVAVLQPKDPSKHAPDYVIYANYFSTPAKNLMLVYGHVNVPQVTHNDGWQHHPFKLTEHEGQLYGNGLATSKGPIICWIQVVEAWLKKTEDLPVNMRFLIDTCSSKNDPELHRSIDNHKSFFVGVDLLVGSTNLWIRNDMPMITTNHSGYVYFELEVRQQEENIPDQSSTGVGSQPSNARHDPLAEMCLLMGTLSDPNTELSKMLQKHVLPVTHRDWDILCKAEVGIMEYKERFGVKRLLHEESQPLFLKHRWCTSCLSIHSVHHRQFKDKRDVHLHRPRRVVSRFSVKLVADQSVKLIKMVVRQHLDEAYLRFKCQNAAYLRVVSSLKPVNEGSHAPFHLAAQRAFESVFNLSAYIPDTISISMPMMNELRKYCMSTVSSVGLPFCSIHVHTGIQDESLSRKQYELNLELFATLLFEVALLPPDCKCTKIPDFCMKPGKVVYYDFIRMMEPGGPERSAYMYELHESELEKADDERIPPATELLLGNDAKKNQLD